MLHKYQDFIYFNILVPYSEESSVSTVTTSELDDQDPIPKSGINSPFTIASLPNTGSKKVVYTGGSHPNKKGYGACGKIIYCL